MTRAVTVSDLLSKQRCDGIAVNGCHFYVSVVCGVVVARAQPLTASADTGLRKPASKRVFERLPLDADQLAT